MSNKQSSVEWFFDQLVAHGYIVVNKTTYGDKVKPKHEILLVQAKAMHKEEIANTYDDAIEDVRQDEERPLKGSEYYNIHFKKNAT